MMEDTVNKEVIRRRISALKELEKRLAEEFKKQFVGEIAEVLIEDKVKKTGRAERYFKVRIENVNKNDPIRVDSTLSNGAGSPYTFPAKSRRWGKG
jgi:tRNA A37 methylthiotransferase MiaB